MKACPTISLFDLLTRLMAESALDEVCREGGFTRDDIREGRVEIVDGKLRGSRRARNVESRQEYDPTEPGGEK